MLICHVGRLVPRLVGCVLIILFIVRFVPLLLCCLYFYATLQDVCLYVDRHILGQSRHSHSSRTQIINTLLLEMPSPRLRQYGRRNRSSASSSPTGHSSLVGDLLHSQLATKFLLSQIQSTRQSGPFYQRKSVRLQQQRQQRSNSSHSLVIRSSNGGEKSAETASYSLSSGLLFLTLSTFSVSIVPQLMLLRWPPAFRIFRHCNVRPRWASNFLALFVNSLSLQNALVELSAYKDAQRERFTCPICLRLAIKPRV